MIGIKHIASYIPQESIDNVEQARSFGEEAEFATDRVGASMLPVMDSAEDTSDLATRAVTALIEQSGIDPASVQLLMLCTQNPDGNGLPHTSAAVQVKAGLATNLAAFDISLGCSGYVYGLHAAKGFMESAGFTTGIFVTADPYSKIIDRSDKSTSLLFGDASTATLLTNDPCLTIGKAHYATNGSGGENIINRDGRLSMAGRQVFNFAASKVPPQIKALLTDAGISQDDVDLFILHQGSRYIVETLTKRMQLPAEKTPITLAQTGNTVSSSIPLILEDYLNNDDVRTILLSGFGVGLSWGSVILTKTN